MNILVAGVGNTLFGDDGFGSEVARRLSSRPPEEGVQVVDYGNRCFDLVVAMLEPVDAVILIDAVLSPGVPGTMRLVELESTPGEDGEEAGLELHSLEPHKLVRLARRLGCPARMIFLVGCEVSTEAAGTLAKIGLSEAVERAVPAAVRQVEVLIDQIRRPAKA